jgi:hypothetical protein
MRFSVIMSPAIHIDFTITVAAFQGYLIVTLRFPIKADREAVEAWMGNIACAFNAVEPLTDVDLRALYWRQYRISDLEDSVELRKAFTDPEYPEKFDAALKASSGNVGSMELH